METRLPFGVRTTFENDVVRLALHGELDVSVTDVMTESLIMAEAHGASAVVLDLGDLSFIDSSGLHVIVDAWKRAEENGHRLRVVAASPIARRLFTIVDVEFLLDEAGDRPTLMPSPRDGSQGPVRSRTTPTLTTDPSAPPWIKPTIG